MPKITEYYPQFFTATILEWKTLLNTDKYIDIIIESLRFLVLHQRIKLFCFVIMPNHIHLIWQIQAGHKRENVQRDFLKFTSQNIRYDLMEFNNELLQEFKVDAKDREYQIWERNPLSIDLYNHKIFMQKLEYIHTNPLQEKWNLANSEEAYIYSSALFYETGIDNWGFLTHYKD